jgi:hypothetical protein
MTACPLRSPAQSAAIAHVAQYARVRRDQARRVIAEVGAMCDIAADSMELAIARVREHARVALHFHPDRPDDQLRTVAENLLDSGRYKSQFETRLSNGGLSAFPGGARDDWERALFGGAYHAEAVDSAHRPKYGAWDLMRHADGPSPRFGSCFFLLSPEASKRCTFTYLDSHQQPLERGTYDELDDIVAALFKDAFTRDWALGTANLAPPRLIEHCLTELPKPLPDPSDRAPSRNLDHYIEAQLHGDARLEMDVEALVIDPSFERTETGEVLAALCERYDIACRWHAGFELAPSAVPRDFRGPTMPSLAKRVAIEGRLNAAAIGRAVSDLKQNPSVWSSRGSEAEVLQELKLLWHVLVRFGERHVPRSRDGLHAGEFGTSGGADCGRSRG